MSRDRTELMRLLGVVVLLALVALTARLLLVLFAGVLLAIVLRAIARFGSLRMHVPYWLCLTVLVLAGLALTAGFVIVFLPRFAEEFTKLWPTLEQSYQRMAGALHLQAPPADKLREALSSEKFLAGAVNSASAALEVAAAPIVVLFVGIYGAADPRLYERVALAVLPATARRRASRVMRTAAGQLERWLLGRLVAMAFVAVTTGVAFSLLHLPMWLPLSVLAGVLTFVEYVGAVASAIPALLLGFTEGPLTALWVGVLFTALHVVEGYVLTPMLAKSSVRIPPAYGLASQVLLSALVGPLGLTFSTPLLVVAAVVQRELAAPHDAGESAGERAG